MLSILNRCLKLLASHWQLLILLALAIAILIWTSPKFVKMLDEGMLASTAMKIAGGQVLYRDAFEFWTPISVYLTAGVFSLFGATVLTLRVLAAIILILNTLCVYYLLGHISHREPFRLLGSIVFIGITYSFVEMNHHWLGMLFLLATLISLTKLVESKSLWWATLSGITASLTFLSVQLEGAVAVSLCLLALITWFRGMGSIKIWLTLTLAGLTPALAVIIYFGLQGALTELLYSTIAFPLTQYRSVNGAYSNLTQFAQLLLVGVLTRHWLRHFPGSTARLWLITTFLFQGCFIFTANTTVATRYGFFPAIIVLGCIVSISRSAWAGKLITSPQFKPRLAQALALTILAIYAGAYVAADTFAGWRNNILASSKISSPAGIMYARPEVAAKAQVIIDYVHDNTNQGEFVYFGPFAAHYQFLTQKPSPIKYSQLTPKYNPGWMFADAVAQLKKTQTSTIVLLPQENPFDFNQSNQLSQFVMANYQPVTHLPFTTLLSSKKLYLIPYRRQLNNTPQDAIWELKEQ